MAVLDVGRHFEERHLGVASSAKPTERKTVRSKHGRGPLVSKKRMDGEALLYPAKSQDESPTRSLVVECGLGEWAPKVAEAAFEKRKWNLGCDAWPARSAGPLDADALTGL